MDMTGWLDRTLYPGVSDHWDDLILRERVMEHLARRPMDVLDLGAGAGIVEAMNFRGAARSVRGVDPDPRVVDNPYLDEGRVGRGEAIPYPDGSFDLVVANNVLEHLPSPDATLSEVRRVLRPGGVFIAKTPNRRHYVPTVARLTPHGFHEFVAKIRGRAAEDTFPTLYRANTPSDLERLARAHGFSLTLDLVESRPEYLRIHPATYLFGWIYERTVNRFRWLAPFRVILLIEMVRGASAASSPERAGAK